jgi:phospholipid/cholesterol/gamma-HCH transport system permease protein
MATQAVQNATDTPKPSRGAARPSLAQTVLVFIGECGDLAGRSIGFVLRGQLSLRHTLLQMSSIGVDSVPLVIAASLSTGAVYAFYTADIMVKFGAVSFVGGTHALSFLLELGPILAGINVASRSGAAIAAEIGSMVVTEQVDALRALAVSPVRYLVAPRLVACVAMMPLIAVFADVAGILGGLEMAGTRGVPHAAFIDSARVFATGTDFLKGLIKAACFGFITVIIACQQGLRTSGGATGVGRATTSSVVLCVLAIFIADFFLAQVLAGAWSAVR